MYKPFRNYSKIECKIKDLLLKKYSEDYVKNLNRISNDYIKTLGETEEHFINTEDIKIPSCNPDNPYASVDTIQLNRTFSKFLDHVDISMAWVSEDIAASYGYDYILKLTFDVITVYMPILIKSDGEEDCNYFAILNFKATSFNQLLCNLTMPF